MAKYQGPAGIGKEERKIDISISQVDSKILIEIDGKKLPDIFSGYELKSSSCGEPELWLSVKGIVNVVALSASLSEPLK